MVAINENSKSCNSDNTKNTPSMSKDSARVYYFSLIENIQHILKNLTLKSPLFGLFNLVTMQGIINQYWDLFSIGLFNCDDFVKYNSTSKTIKIGRIRSFVIVNTKILARVQRLLPYKQVPQFLHSKQYSPHLSQELYLVEESELFIIDPSNLICLPFGGNFKDFIKVFIEEVQQLEQGFVMNVNGVDCWILGGLAIEFKNISEQQTNLARLQMSSHYGLRLLPGSLDPIFHDRYQYTPQDAYHAVAEKVEWLLECTCLILIDQGERNIIKYWKHFEISAIWVHLPNFIFHRHSFMISDILNHAHRYATCVNMVVGIKEIVYRIFKSIVPHTNKQNLELILLWQVNTLQTLRYLVNRRIDDRIGNIEPKLFKELILESRLHHLLSGWCIDNSNFSIHALEKFAQDNDNLTKISSFSHFNCSKIKLGSKWSKQKIENTGFAILNTKIRYYQNTSYSIVESNSDFQDVRFCVSQAVETTLSNNGQLAFGVVKGIIEYK
ncbi:39065_t:CDS:2 [Gigaspora margarita]|uniref:39065_t:CDS:1 n=1 Tax=Gigaspora margarita TaxID=4874 RepID=A0ABM8W4H6_GIGMA|nr:39065_t:CDS:2 [Gigaspora margarita]